LHENTDKILKKKGKLNAWRLSYRRVTGAMLLLLMMIMLMLTMLVRGVVDLCGAQNVPCLLQKGSGQASRPWQVYTGGQPQQVKSKG
jgi:hypothetical protein